MAEKGHDFGSEGRSLSFPNKVTTSPHGKPPLQSADFGHLVVAC